MRSRAVLVSGVMVLCVGGLTSCTQSNAGGVRLEEVSSSTLALTASSTSGSPSRTSSSAGGATSSSTNQPTQTAQSLSSTTPALTATRTAIPTETTATLTEGLAPDEAADRAAIEAQWIKSWDVYMQLPHIAADERAAVAAEVATEPAFSNLLTDAKTVSDKGWDSYGAIKHKISWPQPVDGKSTAVIADCQDTSQAGSLETATGYKKTVGVPARSIQGSLVRGTDGIWRVAQTFLLKDEAC